MDTQVGHRQEAEGCRTGKDPAPGLLLALLPGPGTLVASTGRTAWNSNGYRTVVYTQAGAPWCPVRTPFFSCPEEPAGEGIARVAQPAALAADPLALTRRIHFAFRPASTAAAFDAAHRRCGRHVLRARVRGERFRRAVRRAGRSATGRAPSTRPGETEPAPGLAAGGPAAGHLPPRDAVAALLRVLARELAHDERGRDRLRGPHAGARRGRVAARAARAHRLARALLAGAGHHGCRPLAADHRRRDHRPGRSLLRNAGHAVGHLSGHSVRRPVAELPPVLERRAAATARPVRRTCWGTTSTS